MSKLTCRQMEVLLALVIDNQKNPGLNAPELAASLNHQLLARSGVATVARTCTACGTLGLAPALVSTYMGAEGYRRVEQHAAYRCVTCGYSESSITTDEAMA